MERTSVINGSSRLLVVAPHGFDDENTAELTEMIARQLGASAVINRGWRRSRDVDPFHDLANCNNIRHLLEDVVREEFLVPIRRSVARIKMKHEENALMVVIHGCKDDTRKEAGDELLDIVLGYGAGHPPSHSCRVKTKNRIAYCLQQEGFGVFEGAAGGLYAGKSKNNLNQFFVRWMPDKKVESIQMEIVHDMRSDQQMVEMTAEGIVSALDAFLLMDQENEDVDGVEIGRV